MKVDFYQLDDASAPDSVIATLGRKVLGEDQRLVMVIAGMTLEGEDVRKTVAVRLGAPGEGRKRLAEAGLSITVLGDDVRVAAVRFGSRARKSGFEQGWQIDSLKVPADRASQHWIYLPAMLLVAAVFLAQGRRLRRG